MLKTPQGRSHFEVAIQKHGTPLWREAHLQVKCGKNLSAEFWKFRCQKITRRCGAKHICKSKCSKHLRVGAIFEVAIQKHGTPLWREAHLQVKMCKKPQCGTNFGSSDVKKSHAAVARSTFSSQNVQNTTLSGHFLKIRWLTN